MDDATTLKLLAELGMDELSYKALALLPLVHVAWADGEVQPSEQALIVDLAETRYALGEEELLLLRNWLRYRPTAEYVRRGRDALLAVVATDPAHGLGDDALGDVVVLSRAVAKAAGGLFGIGAVSRSEADALGEIAAALKVEPGTPFDRAVGGAAPPLGPRVNRVTLTFSSTVTLGQAATDGVLEPDPALGVTERIPVSRRGLTVGSDRHADLRIENDPRVAPLHCRFVERNRKFYVMDLDSEGGTWVGGERVLERRLLGGEVLRVGDVVLAFKLLRKIPKQMF